MPLLLFVVTFPLFIVVVVVTLHSVDYLLDSRCYRWFTRSYAFGLFRTVAVAPFCLDLHGLRFPCRTVAFTLLHTLPRVGFDFPFTLRLICRLFAFVTFAFALRFGYVYVGLRCHTPPAFTVRCYSVGVVCLDLHTPVGCALHTFICYV